MGYETEGDILYKPSCTCSYGAVDPQCPKHNPAPDGPLQTGRSEAPGFERTPLGPPAAALSDGKPKGADKPKGMRERESILQEAQRIIFERPQAYGHPKKNFASIAELWSAYLGREITVVDVAHMQILVKIARQKTGYHRDSSADIAGYAGCLERIFEE